MNRQEANQLLNQVREGVLHPQSTIIKALTITGDICGKLTSPDSTADSGCSSSDSPITYHAVVQSPQGEPQ
jgi:hypothetical protein